MTAPIIENEEYIDFHPILKSFLVRCVIHRVWECRAVECQQEMGETLDRLIKEEFNPRGSCGFSQPTAAPEHHAPVGVDDPFTKKDVDNTNRGLIGL